MQHFESSIFSFNPYVSYLICDFVASTHGFNPPARAFNLSTQALILELVLLVFWLDLWNF